MGFKQTFENVKTVKNLDNISLNAEQGSSNSGFEQNYSNIFEVINVQYDGNHLAVVDSLVQQILKMDEDQVDKFIDELKLHCSSEDDKESTEYENLERAISKKIDKKNAILEYIKAGTTSMSFATSLLTLIKTVLGFMA